MVYHPQDGNSPLDMHDARNSPMTARPETMPPKLDDDTDTVRIQIVAPKSWVARIDAWRRQQEKIPSQSAAIRELVDAGLEAGQKDKR